MSTPVKIALLQMRSGLDPRANLAFMERGASEAAAGGARMLFTPEISGLCDQQASRARESIRTEENDPVLAGMRQAARQNEIWIAIGSLAIRKDNERWANRAFVIDSHGEIVARYDKIHMFDVELGNGDDWRESAIYDAGEQVVTVDTPAGRLGLAICYDIRFPALYEALGNRKCDIIVNPAAFTAPTGEAHWHVLQRARAIEASAFMVSAAQCGQHEDGRTTFGHSLVVDPWGEVLLDMEGDATGVAFAEIQPERISQVRSRLPSLANRRPIAD